MNFCVIQLGGNMENTKLIFKKAIQYIQQEIGELKNKSSIYLTEPWGFDSENYFLNQLLEIESILSSIEILNIILKIENLLGRDRRYEYKYTSRIIDIDILLYNDEIHNKDRLIIPHPKIQERKFILEPLNELYPELIHPVLGKSIEQLKKECTDSNFVIKL